MPNDVRKIQNNISDHSEVADAIVRRTMADREAEYAADVRNLLDAALRVIRRFGTSGSPRVVDIITEAGVSTDVFYRHFRGKDELVTALLEEGTARMHDHLVRQMATASDPADRVRRWVTGVLTPATAPETAAEIRAVLWNGARVSDDTRRRVAAREILAEPLLEPLMALGSTDPRRDALVISHATLGRHEEFLWRRRQPTPEDIEHLVDFCLRAVNAGTDQHPKGLR